MNTNHLCPQIILKRSRCIPAILLCVQHRIAYCQTQRLLWLYTPKYIFFLNPIVWTWSSLLFLGISDFKLVRFTQPDIGQIYLAWQLLTKNSRLNSCNMTHPGLLVGLHFLLLLWLRYHFFTRNEGVNRSIKCKLNIFQIYIKISIFLFCIIICYDIWNQSVVLKYISSHNQEFNIF